MTSIEWDAYQVLDVARRGSDNIICFAMTKDRTRCSIKLGPYQRQRILDILEEIEQRAPNEAVGALATLAQLGCCSRYHSSMGESVTRAIVCQWEKAIGNIAGYYELAASLNKEIHELKLEARTNLNAYQNAAEELMDERKRCQIIETQIRKERQACVELGNNIESLNRENAELSQQLVSEREAHQISSTKYKELRQEFELEETTYSYLRHGIRAANEEMLKANIALEKAQETITKGAVQEARLSDEVKWLKDHPLQTLIWSVMNDLCARLDGWIGHFLE